MYTLIYVDAAWAEVPGHKQRSPQAWRSTLTPENRGWVLGLDGDARVVHNLQGSKGSYAPITGVRVVGDWMYLGSLEGDSIARIAAPRTGASA